jgi:hypothetical protein
MDTRRQQAANQVYVPRYHNPYSVARGPALSRERIRQIETIALRKLRRELILRGLQKDHLLG